MCEARSRTFDYHLFGLKIRSEIHIPELAETNTDEEADVMIRFGDRPGAAEFVIDEVVRFAVFDGREIWITPAAGADHSHVRLYLLGSAMGLLLHQRGMLPLHANAIEVDGAAVAFIGASGSGKSTLAAWFHDRGHRVIADDVCVVGFADEEASPVAYPGLPRLRLWKEALEASGRDVARYRRSYAGDESWDKFDVPLDRVMASDSATPLRAIYLLDKGDESRIETLSGIEAADALFANTYRGQFVAEAGKPERHWQACIRLVHSIPILRAVRRWDLAGLDGEAIRLRQHACGLVKRHGQ